ncbi:hypothetical protein ACFSKM_08850 [Ancylobacter dichloromethanicus]|uniref:Uncharacterized protein n=1 Tax=Ancylobacter dichloromethanicus TaxID=518825 RepID=A0A9W6MYC4_9HYPH|nr:hypothetical protein [Ancylobacter dichloromethanicus]GLK70978.1 hypothetical protein GCM10017643_10930 [Ancylobacter dichloromethanicus]
MPIESLIFVAGVVIAFTGFAAALAYVEASTKATRRKNHPLPGE